MKEPLEASGYSCAQWVEYLLAKIIVWVKDNASKPNYTCLTNVAVLPLFHSLTSRPCHEDCDAPEWTWCLHLLQSWAPGRCVGFTCLHSLYVWVKTIFFNTDSLKALPFLMITEKKCYADRLWIESQEAKKWKEIQQRQGSEAVRAFNSATMNSCVWNSLTLPIRTWCL